MWESITQLPWWFWASHVLLIPLYVIIGTAKHELSHVVAGKIAGMKILKIQILPSIKDGQFFMGYVTWELGPYMSKVPKYVYRMPYFVDLLVWAFGMWLTFNSGIDWPSMAPITGCYWLSMILGVLIISPMLDVAYNVYKYAAHNRGDFAEVAKQ